MALGLCSCLVYYLHSESRLANSQAHSIQLTAQDREISLLIKLQRLEDVHSQTQQQLKEANEKVKKFAMKLYEAEKRVRLFGEDDQGLSPLRAEPLPDFIIMGTWKAGTTSLHKIFLNHPNVCLSLGEPNFFVRPNLRVGGKGVYRAFFKRCFTRKGTKRKDTSKPLVIGEKSPTYLFNCARICPKIKAYNPNVKLIISLRNPIERAYSNWFMDWCKGVFNGTFESFITRNPKSLEAGIYLHQIKSVLEHFPKEQVMVIKSEEFFAGTRKWVRKVEDFLEVNHYNFTDTEVKVYGTGPKCLEEFGPRSTIPDKLMATLKAYFQTHNQQLESFMTENFGWGPLLWD